MNFHVVFCFCCVVCRVCVCVFLCVCFRVSSWLGFRVVFVHVFLAPLLDRPKFRSFSRIPAANSALSSVSKVISWNSDHGSRLWPTQSARLGVLWGIVGNPGFGARMK